MRKLTSSMIVAVLLLGSLGTTAAAFPSGGALPPALTLVIPVAGVNGVPDDAEGVAMNVTVTGAAAAGFVTVYPCGPLPSTSNLNYVQDQTVPNFVVSGLSPDGEVCIDTFAVVDIVVDLAGYLPSGSPIEMLDQPERIVDTRQAIGLPGPLVAGAVAEVQVGGSGAVPSDSSLVLFNATVTKPGAAGFLSVFPCGEALPPTSTLNFTMGATVPNFVVAKIGSAGRVCLFSNSPTEVLLDVAGYVPAGVADVVPLQSPVRLLDTRFGIGGLVEKLTSAGRTLQLGGVGGIPDLATAVVVNLTATLSSGSGFVSAYPCGGAAPLVSNLNFTAGSDVANMAIVKLGTAGHLCLTSNNDVDVIADVTGYVVDDASITALPPVRIYDSRDGVDPRCNRGLFIHGDGFLMYDLSTGSTIGGVHGIDIEFPRVFLRDDCRTVDLVGFVPSLGGYRGWVYDMLASPFDNILSTYALPDHGNDILFTDQGPLSLRRVVRDPLPAYSEVVDAISGLVLFALPEQPRATDGALRIWQQAGATSDGSLIALRVPSPDNTRTIVSYWTPDGQQVGEWLSPVGAFDFRLSPTGSYLAYAISSGSVTTNGFVVTLDGSLVTTMPPAPVEIGPWLTDGSMLGCTRRTTGQAPIRWDMFSPVKDLVLSDFKMCLSAAR